MEEAEEAVLVLSEEELLRSASMLLLQEHWTLVISFWGVDSLEMSVGGELLVVVVLAEVRSQCFLMNMGMSEKARKRWVFIWALDRCQFLEFGIMEYGKHLDSLMREIERML